MGAFWEAWNKQGQVNDQAAMSQIQQAAGLAGLIQQANAVKAQEAAKGILASDVPDDVKIKGLMSLGAPGIQMANQLAMMQEHQQKAAKEKRINDFWTKEAPNFNTPSQPELRSQALPGGMMGPAPEGQGGILQPYKPAGVDFEGLLNRGAQVGAVSPEALVNHRAQQAERAAAREDRMAALRLQIEERIQRGRDTADLRRELADQANQARLDSIRLAASLRHAPQQAPLVPIKDANGNWVYATREQAVGQAAPPPSSELRIDAGSKSWASREVKNFKSDPEVKRFESLSPSVEAISTYITRMQQKGATSDNVEDLNLTKLYLGITQQKGERLTNMDKKGLSSLASLDKRFGNAISSFLSGKDLTDEVRNGMWRTVVNQMAALQKVKDARKDELIKRAAANNVDKALLFGSEE